VRSIDLERRRHARGSTSAGGPGGTGAAHGLGTVLVGNVAAAAIGFAQSVVVVRALGVAEYGVYGILAAVAAVATNALDLRLGDATMRRFFGSAPQARDAARDPLALLLAGAIAQAIVGTAIAIVTVASALVVFRGVPEAGLAIGPIAAFAASEAFAYTGRFVLFSLRFARRPGSLAVSEVLVVSLRSAIVAAAVIRRPSIEGLILGLAVSGPACLLLAAAAFARLWVLESGLRTRASAVARELRLLVARRRELLALGTINHQNLLHRGADVLVLGLLAGEREAGLYKLARSATDAVYILYDAAAKVLQPLFMELVAVGDLARVRRFAWRATALSAAGVGLLLALEAWALEPVVRAVFGESFVPACGAILLLTAPAFFVFGCHLWAWPLLVGAGEVRAYAATALVAVVAAQYGVGIAGLLLFPSGATWFAFAFLAADVLLWAAFWPRAARLLREDAEPQAPRLCAAGGDS
jgi:O-antigen/teichoic acid export membrane protein